MATATKVDTARLAAPSASCFLTPWSVQSPATGMPAIVGGEGAFLVGDDGARFMDLASGWIAANLGHGRHEIADAVACQLGTLAYAPPIFPHPLRQRVADRIVRLAPWPEGGRVHFTTGGGEAIDDAQKIARLLTGRHKIMAAYRSYHGTTLGASGATGDMRRWANEPAATPAVRFFAPYPYRSPFHTDDPAEEVRRAIDHLERILTQENAASVAALVIEPVVGSSGLVVYPDGYLAAVRALTERHGILLVFDEVMTGFGRVGAPFAAGRFGVTPDMIVFAKGVNGATLPLGGVAIREQLARRFDDLVFDAGHTHAGHLVALASADAALDIYERERLFERGHALEALLRSELGGLAESNPIIGDVRGVGAFFGLELVRDRASREELVPWYAADKSITARLTTLCLEEGVWTYCRYGIVMIAPPLSASDEEVKAGVAGLGRALRRLRDELGL